MCLYVCDKTLRMSLFQTSIMSPVDCSESYASDWLERRATEVVRNRRLLQHRTDCQSPEKEIKKNKDLSNIYGRFISDHAGGVNYGRFIEDWVDDNYVPLFHNM